MNEITTNGPLSARALISPLHVTTPEDRIIFLISHKSPGLMTWQRERISPDNGFKTDFFTYGTAGVISERFAA